jgi:uncharacterized RmlC-like cupin family protein
MDSGTGQISFCHEAVGSGGDPTPRDRGNDHSGDVDMSEPIRVVPPDALVDADPTPGVRRLRAIDAPGLWSGVAQTDPGATSGWHHHGEHETSLYVVSGALRLEFGPGGQEVAEAGPGQFVHVPAHTIHRESNPTGELAIVVIARAGNGAVTVNLDGPEAS